MYNREFDKWIGLRRPAHDRKVCLIAFSYAGGGAAAFNKWATDLRHEHWLDFVAVQLPGRARRASEPAFTELEPMLDKLEEIIEPFADIPYILCGYSMGAILAYELAARMIERGKRPPQGVILAAQMAPDPGFKRRERHQLPRETFIEELRVLGGTDPTILENEKFMDFFLETLRADFAIVDRYKGTARGPLACPFFVMGSVNDPEVSVEQLYAWQRYTSREFDLRLFPGGHFFLHSAHSSVMEAVDGLLGKSLTDEVKL